MARTGRVPADEDPFSDDATEPPRRRRAAPRTGGAARGSVKAWSPDGEEEAPEEWEEDRPRRFRLGGEGSPVYWRARDSLYFEPLVALAIVLLLLVGMFTYAQNWPPAYVIESNSMQHAPRDVPGVLNAGDLVLATKLPTSQIVPYVTGARTGFSTYGEPGDVLLYYPFGERSSTPLVHRAIFFLQWDPVDRSYNATDLSGLPCGDQSNMTAGELYYSTNGTKSGTGGCGTTDLRGGLMLFNVGWRMVTISLDLGTASLGNHSGFLTMGDNNTEPDQTLTNGGSTPALSTLVEPGWIIGVARGMIPWVGALKLLLEGGTHAAAVPSGSWEFLGLTFITVIFVAYGIHYALKREGIESPVRRREEEERAEEEDAGSGGLFGSLRPWGSKEEGDEEKAEKEEERPPPRPRTPSRAPPARPTSSSPPPSNATGRSRYAVHRTPRRRRDDGRL